MESELQGQPYCRITLNPTKEVAGSNIISDAFYKLDFCNAIRDIRRFAYVSKLLHLLITQNLTSLSGNATKALFWMLEEIAKQGTITLIPHSCHFPLTTVLSSRSGYQQAEHSCDTQVARRVA